jgi:hypothetical protein
MLREKMIERITEIVSAKNKESMLFEEEEEQLEQPEQKKLETQN